MKKPLLTLSFFLTISMAAICQAGQEYGSTLKKMFEVSGSEASYQAVIKQMLSMYKQNYSNVEANVWNEMEQEFAKTSLDDLTDMLVPVYSKYMTIDYLEELITFYETPIGKKFAQNTPLIMQESMQIGQQWGMKIGHEFEKKMKEKGY